MRTRSEPGLKDRVEHVFRKPGLTTTQSMTLFYKQVELRNGLPFEVAIPTEATPPILVDTDAEGWKVPVSPFDKSSKT